MHPAGLAEPVVHGGDAEQHGGLGYGLQYPLGRKPVHHRGAPPGGQRAEETGAQPMDVEEGQRQNEMVIGLPAPGQPDGLHAGQEGAVRVHRTFGVAGRARGVDDEGVVIGLARIQRQVITSADSR